MTDSTTLGILGGLGPMSGVYFCEMLTAHTHAELDSDHINFFLSSRADTPDRTEYILNPSAPDPTPVMIREVDKLITAGAELIAIPCNTAHHFYESISAASPVPVINIIRQTVDFCRHVGASTVGVLATEGTVASGAYDSICREVGLVCLTPTKEEQSVISCIIYEQIKRGQAPDLDAFSRVADSLLARGCDRLILGCTELSLLNKYAELNRPYVDSLAVLAYSAIRLCGKEPIGFSAELMTFAPRPSL